MVSDGNLRLSDEFQNNASADTKKRVVIFTSGSLVAHQHMNDLLPFFEQQGVEPVVLVTPGSKSPRAKIPSLSMFEFYDSTILEDVVFPTLEEQKSGNRLSPTFNELMKRHSVSYQYIDSLKDPAVMEAINAPGTIGAISIYQDSIFKPDLIDAIQQKGFFWNLHPAVLPGNQGLYVIFWTMMKGEQEQNNGYTLHEVDEGIDTGRIICTASGPIDKSKSVFESYVDFSSMGSELVKKAFSQYMREGTVDYATRGPETPTYYTFPTEEDIKRGWEKGVRLWGTPDEMLDIYTRIFGNDKILVERLKDALATAEETARSMQVGPQATGLPPLPPPSPNTGRSNFGAGGPAA